MRHLATFLAFWQKETYATTYFAALSSARIMEACLSDAGFNLSSIFKQFAKRCDCLSWREKQSCSRLLVSMFAWEARNIMILQRLGHDKGRLCSSSHFSLSHHATGGFRDPTFRNVPDLRRIEPSNFRRGMLEVKWVRMVPWCCHKLHQGHWKRSLLPIQHY